MVKDPRTRVRDRPGIDTSGFGNHLSRTVRLLKGGVYRSRETKRSGNVLKEGGVLLVRPDPGSPSG